MPVFISMLRAVNVGGNNQLKMDALRELCETLGHKNVQTHIQSGNVLFWSKEKDPAAISKRLQKAIEKHAGFAPEVILRTVAEMEAVIARNPFAGRKDVPPNKLLVTFFDRELDPAGVAAVNAMQLTPEEFHIRSRELYVYYPEGSGRSKFPAVSIAKTLKASGTARNWNTVLKLLALAAQSELRS